MLFIPGPSNYGIYIRSLYDSQQNNQDIESVLITDEYYRKDLNNNICNIPDASSYNSITMFSYSEDILAQIDLNIFRNLRWIQFIGVGFETIINLNNLIHKDLIITNCKGASSQALAEFGIYSFINYLKQMNHFRNCQKQKKWAKQQFKIENIQCLRNKKLLVIGLGQIGLQLAKYAKVFGVSEIVGLKKQVNDQIKSEINKEVKIDTIDQLNQQSLHNYIAKTDLIFMSLPGTPELNKIINKETLKDIRPGTILVNVGRGSNINEQDLIECIKSKDIKVALDPTEDEPYDSNYGLLDESISDNVLLTSHQIDISTTTFEEYKAILEDNIQNFKFNRPLNFQIDVKQGY